LLFVSEMILFLGLSPTREQVLLGLKVTSNREVTFLFLFLKIRSSSKSRRGSTQAREREH